MVAAAPFVEIRALLDGLRANVGRLPLRASGGPPIIKRTWPPRRTPTLLRSARAHPLRGASGMNCRQRRNDRGKLHAPSARRHGVSKSSHQSATGGGAHDRSCARRQRPTCRVLSSALAQRAGAAARRWRGAGRMARGGRATLRSRLGARRTATSPTAAWAQVVSRSAACSSGRGGAAQAARATNGPDAVGVNGGALRKQTFGRGGGVGSLGVVCVSCWRSIGVWERREVGSGGPPKSRPDMGARGSEPGQACRCIVWYSVW